MKITEIYSTQCGNFKNNFPHDFLAKIPSKYFFTKELYYELISRKFFEVGVNFRNFHTVYRLICELLWRIFHLKGFFFVNSVKSKFLDAGIQDVSTSISIAHDLIEMCDGTGDESDKHI